MVLNTKILLFLAFSFTTLAQTQMREIIRFDHQYARKKCEEKGKKIHQEYFESIDYQVTGKKRYVSRYHKNCEEAVCKVFFSNEAWQFQKGFFVCDLVPDKIKQEDEYAQLMKNNALKERKVIVAKRKTQTTRRPASVKPVINEIPKAKVATTIGDNLQLSCQEFVKDINGWLVDLAPVNGVPQKKNAQGLFSPLKASFGTQKVAQAYYNKTQDETYKVLDTKIEMVKLKLKSLKNSDHTSKSFMQRHVTEYNSYIAKQFGHYMDLAKTYCFDSFVENHQTMIKNLKTRRSIASEEKPTEEDNDDWLAVSDGLILEN